MAEAIVACAARACGGSPRGRGRARGSCRAARRRPRPAPGRRRRPRARAPRRAAASVSKRFTSSKGGAWFATSWVSAKRSDSSLMPRLLRPRGSPRGVRAPCRGSRATRRRAPNRRRCRRRRGRRPVPRATRAVRITTERSAPPRSVEVAEGAGVDAASHRLEGREEPHRRELRRAGHRARREGGAEQIDASRRRAAGPPPSTPSGGPSRRTRRAQLGHRDAPGGADPPEVVAHEVDDHQVLGAVLLGRGERARRARGRAPGSSRARPRPLDRAALDAAVRVEAQEALGRRRADREPPAARARRAKGAGLRARSVQ